jgi:fatty-acyl-CoA synthase
MIGSSVGRILDQLARNFADRDAVVDGGQTYSYRAFFRDVRRVGRALLGLGLNAGDRVAIISGDRLEVITVYYGAMWAGLTAVPLNPRLSLDDHAYILENTAARAVLYDSSTMDRILELRERLDIAWPIAADRAALVAGAELLADLAARAADDFGAPEASVTTPVLIVHTGGTTGRPKGVTHTHQSLVAALYSLSFEADLQRDDRFFHATPLAHAGGMLFFSAWLKGASNYLMGGFDPPRLLDAIERDRLTSSLLIPTMIYQLLDVPGVEGRDLSSLRSVIYAGAPMAKERLLQAIDVCGQAFVQMYGQAEAPAQITVLSRDAHVRAVAAGDDALLRSCGWPVMVADVMVADDDLGALPPGEVGEICVRGPHVMRGYWNDPEETALSLRDGWLRTGDLAEFDDERGVYTLVDRKKDMIISGGYNVYPAQVEKVLFAHPQVANVCVIGVPDDKWGEAVKAVVVPARGTRPDPAELIEFAKRRAGRWLAPKSVDFVEEIPLTMSNKYDKQALRAPYWKDHDRAVN